LYPKSESENEVFDPFRLDDQEVKPSQQTFSLLNKMSFDFESCDWNEFGSADTTKLVLGNKGSELSFSNEHQSDHEETTGSGEEVNNTQIREQHIKGAGQSFLSEVDDGFSISSFPIRTKPIEFLKQQNRIVDTDDEFTDDIFLKIDESAHMRCPNIKRESTAEENQEDASSDCTCTTPQIQQVETGIEVIDSETLASLQEQQLNESQSKEEQQNDKCPPNKSIVTDQLNPDCGNGGMKTPKDEMSPTQIESKHFEDQKRDVIDEPTIRPKSTPSYMQDETDCSSRDEGYLPENLAEFAAPVLLQGSDENPIKLAINKLRISLSENSFAEGSIKIPLNVKIKHKTSKVAHTQREINTKHSIHFDKIDSRKQEELGISQCNSSLLDSVTEVSDVQSMSTQSSVNPIKRLQTIDTKTVDSGGSVSALSFLGRSLSTYSADEDTCKGDVHPIIPIPRGPTRRAESDFASIDEKSAVSTRKENKCHRPLGATASEIRGINTFLAIAGPDFDGARLSIEEREDIFKKAFEAGLTENFINKMLDQSAGIRLWEQQSAISEDQSAFTEESSAHFPTPSTRPCRRRRCAKANNDDSTKVTMMSSYSEDLTYDEDGFTRRTPKEDTFSCLKNIFWMESSNIVGDDMTENLMAVISQDSESIYSRRRPPVG
jgi:hypothetical protein